MTEINPTTPGADRRSRAGQPSVDVGQLLLAADIEFTRVPRCPVAGCAICTSREHLATAA